MKHILIVALLLSATSVEARVRRTACFPVSGIVDRIEDATATLELPWGGEADVSMLCLPSDVEEGTVLVQGRIDVAATRRERAQSRRLIEQLLRMRPRRISLGWGE